LGATVGRRNRRPVAAGFELLAKVDAGEEVVMARGNEPVAKRSTIRRAVGRQSRRCCGRAMTARKKVGLEEILRGATKGIVTDGFYRRRSVAAGSFSSSSAWTADRLRHS
jgi:antitoxin (DNA-binding transcriptional repressor) of toxin-antitoxin stability system